ncbi:MAG TPA: hypothetical protein VGV68_01630, partial [Terriglobia bacterium]|nr:hypothetical protein [Terriglobia bacterium]
EGDGDLSGYEDALMFIHGHSADRAQDIVTRVRLPKAYVAVRHIVLAVIEHADCQSDPNCGAVVRRVLDLANSREITSVFPGSNAREGQNEEEG